ncbi:MBL fold metallo-hydrolase, partial [Candidatus Bipolaricaulota bacterium]|nr:MBL fold metallo-hydrolase [Candidatus Bipolaricaulota bacterium]
SVILATRDTLFVGDLLFAGSVGRTDLPGGSLTQMKQSLKKLLALPGNYRVYPGHGEETTLDRERRTNPYILSWR